MNREFRLSPPGKGGVSCGADGAFVGAIPVLERLRKNGKDTWHPRECDELSEEVGKHYGLPIDISPKRGGLKAIANALNDGDVARAQIATVLLGIPDPPPLSKGVRSRAQMIKLIRDLHWSGMIKWDPDKHPRWPAGSAGSTGGEFAPEDEGGQMDASPTSQAGAAVRTNSNDGKPNTGTRSARVQLADNAASDAADDPVAEAVRAGADERQNSSATHPPAKSVEGEHENFWEAFGSGLSHGAKTALTQIGQANSIENYLTIAVEERNAIVQALRAYSDYRAQPWTTSDGRPIEVPTQPIILDPGNPLAGPLALEAQNLSDPNAPPTRPATNADWIDPLFNLASIGAMGAGVPFRFAGPIADALDTADIAASSANAAEIASTLDQLSAAASRAAAKVGEGSGGLHGTTIHSAFRAEVDALGNPNLFTERSYLNGVPVDYGTPGSIRLDVVEGSITNPTTVYDLKTGGATLTRLRIQQIRSHLPPTANSVPIKEVRP